MNLPFLEHDNLSIWEVHIQGVRNARKMGMAACVFAGIANRESWDVQRINAYSMLVPLLYRMNAGLATAEKAKMRRYSFFEDEAGCRIWKPEDESILYIYSGYLVFIRIN